MYNIGISCVGGGVGQSVINSCRLSSLPLKTIGLDTNPFAYGAYDCDVFDSTLSVTKGSYISELISKCKEHNIDLIIPGLDDEILMYAQNLERFEEAGIKTIVSGEDLIKLCRDKEKMSLELNPIADVFVKSYDRDTLRDGIKQNRIKFPLIAKPRGGSASKGIVIIQNEDDLDKIKDNHIVQELAIPSREDPNYDYYIDQISKNRNPQVSEVSVQLVTDKEGNLLGKMASYNKLRNGIPIEIVPIRDDRIWDVVDELLPHFVELGLRGPLNIQGRLTEEGLKIFEMNPRFTGITGLRALMGFNEVESCIADWLDIDRDDISLTFNYNRFGIRQTADKTIQIDRNDEVGKLSREINSGNEKTVQNLLVTGADSYLGQRFISDILEEDEYNVWLYGPDKKELSCLFPQEEVNIYDNTDLKSGKLSMGNVDVLLHIGFAESQQTNEEIAGSLAFTYELFTTATMHQIPAIVNISSQSVYGMSHDSLWNEEMPVAPQTNYAQAEYAVELMLKSISRMNKQTKTTSLRLAELSGGGPWLMPVDQVAGFVLNALHGEEIKIVGGSQLMERLDIRDAITAIKSILTLPEQQWKPVYNVGPARSHSVKDIAEMAIKRARKLNGQITSDIVIEDKPITLENGMDSSLFMKDTGWSPSYHMEDMIDSLFKYFQAQVLETNGNNKLVDS